MQGLVLLIEISIKKNIIHVVKDHNMDQKGKDNKSGKNLFWNISTYAHVSFHEIGFVSNLILFKETFVISRYKYWILYFFSCWEGKSFTCCKWIWSTNVVFVIGLCISRTPKLLDGLNYKFKGEDIGRRRSWGTLLGS
jgi:hypothetical protein